MGKPIQYTNNIYIDFIIKNKSKEYSDGIGISQFIKLSVVTENDNLLPVCNFVFKLPDMRLLDDEILDKDNPELHLKYANVLGSENSEYYKFRIINYDIKLTDQNEVIYSLFGILKAQTYDTNVAIKCAKDMTSSDAIKYFVNGDGTENKNTDIELIVDDDYFKSSDDKQNWLRHNCSIKECVNRVLKNAWVENDAPLAIVDLEGKLRIIQIKKTLEKKDSVETFSEMEGKTGFDKYSIATQRGLFQQAFMEGREQPVIDFFDKDKSNSTTSWLDSILDFVGFNVGKDKPVSANSKYSEDCYDYPILINNGNCYEIDVQRNYYKAILQNIKIKALLHTLNINLTLSQSWFKEDKLKVGDIVDFLPIYNSKPIDYIKGRFMITRRESRFENNKFAIELVLSRPLELTY